MVKKTKQVAQEEEAETMEVEASKEVEKSSYEGTFLHKVRLIKSINYGFLPELLHHVSVIAKPMASKKLTKRIYKLLKKGMLQEVFLLHCFFNLIFILASKQKGFVRNGLKDVQRRIRLGERG